MTIEWTDLSYQEAIAGQGGAARVPGGRPAGLPRARRAVRELELAARGDSDRADVHAVARSPASSSPAAITICSCRSAWSC